MVAENGPENSKTGSASVKSTAAQIAGYIQPFYFCKMAEEEDVDAFNDHFVIVYPKEKDSMIDDYVDLPEQYRNALGSVFQKIYEAHQTPKEYKFNEQGLESFKFYHDDLSHGNAMSLMMKTDAGFFLKPKAKLPV